MLKWKGTFKLRVTGVAFTIRRYERESFVRFSQHPVAVYTLYHPFFHGMLGYRREFGLNLLVTSQAQIVAALHKQMFRPGLVDGVAVTAAQFVSEMHVKLA
jgi:hypothetical protein